MELLKRPRVSAGDLVAAGDEEAVALGVSLSSSVLDAVQVELKYEGYVVREKERAARLREQANFLLDNDLPFMEFVTLSYEAREKLARIRPETLAQAARIPGVTPADLQNLLLEVRRSRATQSAVV